MNKATLNKYNKIAHFQSFFAELFETDDVLFSPEDFKDLLEFIGVDNILLGFFNVLENFSNLAKLIPDICSDDKWHFIDSQIYDVQCTADLLLSSCAPLKSSFPQFVLDPSKTLNSSFSRKISHGPMYCTLGYGCRAPEFKLQYQQLMAQVLIARCILCSELGWKVDERLVAVLKEIRSIANQTSSNQTTPVLKFFPEKCVSPDVYLAQLRSVPEVQEKKTPTIKAIIDYLDYARSKVKLSTPTELGKQSNEGNKVDLNLLSSPDDQDELDGLDDIDVCENLEQISPDDGPISSSFLYVFWGNKSRDFYASPQYLANQVALRRAMDNQCLASAWDELNQRDIQVLLQEIFGQTNNAPSTYTLHAQLALMLFAGMSAKRLCCLQISYNDQIDHEGDYFFPHSGVLRLFSPGPDYKFDSNSPYIGQSCHHQCYMDLPLPHEVASILKRCLPRELIGLSGALFLESADQINARTKALLQKLDAGRIGRITLARIQKYMTGVISRMQGGDVTTASLVLGKQLYLARTGIHYAAFSQKSLQQQYYLACQQIFQDACYCSGGIYFYPQGHNFLGTPVRPKMEEFRNLIETFQTRLQLPTKRFATVELLADYHNIYTLYTWCVLSVCIGYRGENSPGLRPSQVDEITGFAVIRDKDSADFYHSRLVWLLPICRVQLQHYRNHVEHLLACMKGNPNVVSGDLFFLTHKGRIIPARRCDIEKRLRLFGYLLPANTQRHLLKSTLQEAGCPVEVIEVFMGHWCHGQEGWAATSALSPDCFRTELESHLSPLIRTLGLTAIAGLQHPPSKLCLPRMSKQKTLRKVKPKPKISKEDLNQLVADPPAKVWLQAMCRNGHNNPPKVIKHQYKVVLVYLSKKYPDIYAGMQNVMISDDDLTIIMKHLLGQRTSARDRYQRLTLFVKGLNIGKKELGWHVNPPAAPVIHKRALNRIRPMVTRRMQGYRSAEKIFIADLEQEMPINQSVQMGQILISAIMFGALTNRGLAQGFVDALVHDWVYSFDKLVWLDLWMIPRPIDQQEQWQNQRKSDCYRRWVADPLTQQLLQRWYQKRAETAPSPEVIVDLDGIYDSYVNHIALSLGQSFPPLDKLLGCVRAWTTLHLPPFLAAYAENSVKSASLPDPSWLRMVSGKHYPSLHPVRSVSDRLKKSKAGPAELKQQIVLIDNLRKGLNAQEGVTNEKLVIWIERYIDEHYDRFCSSALLLAQWATQLLRRRKDRKEHRLTPGKRKGTVYDYLGKIFEELLQGTWDIDLFSLDDEEKYALFSKLIEDMQQGRNGAEPETKFWPKIRRLNQFFGYLQVFENFPEFKIISSGGKSTLACGKAVRSNLISFQEFERVKFMLGWRSKSLNRVETMALVWAILAFRTGMRVSEIHGLLIGDVQGTSQLEVLVRRNDYRELKTKSARRRIPLYALLPEQELLFVSKWCDFRATELGAEATDPLFIQSPLDLKLCPRQEITNIIYPALKRVTGDQSVVIHTLRHSFASLLLARLMLRDDCSLNHLPHFLRNQEFLKASRDELKIQLMANSGTGRKSLFVIASLLGHSDTQTELASYIHCCDWLCSHYLRQEICEPKLTAKAVSQIVGVSLPQAYKILQKDGYCLDRYTPREEVNYISQHPLEAYATEVVLPVQRRKSQTQLSFEQVLHQVHNVYRTEIRWPQKIVELDVIRTLFYQSIDYAKREEIPVTTMSATAAEAYNAFNKNNLSYEVHLPKLAADIIGLLEGAGAEITARYSPCRWHDTADKKRIRHEWEQVLGRRLPLQNYVNSTGARLARCSGYYSEHGRVDVAITSITLGEMRVPFDAMTSRCLQGLLYLLSHL